MHTFFSDILHVVSQALLVPDIILLLCLIGYALFSIGSVLVEYFTEHKHYEVVMPKLLAALTDSDESLIPSIIEESGLLKRQKAALNTVFEYRTLPGDALVSLIKRLMHEEEAHYDAIVSRNNTAARVAPMLGLMGTLIPLGPGIQALGQADTSALSSSLLVAFDTTVAGLLAAAVCLVIGKIRSIWYDNYLSALDSAMATMLQKIEDSRGSTPIPSAPVASAPVAEAFSQDPFDAPLGSQAAPVASSVMEMPGDPLASPATTGSMDAVGVPMATPVDPVIDPLDPIDSGMAAPIDPVAPATMPSGMPLDPYGPDSSTPGGSTDQLGDLFSNR